MCTHRGDREATAAAAAAVFAIGDGGVSPLLQHFSSRYTIISTHIIIISVVIFVVLFGVFSTQSISFLYAHAHTLAFFRIFPTMKLHEIDIKHGIGSMRISAFMSMVYRFRF